MIHTYVKVHNKHVGAQTYLVPWVCALDSWENGWLLSVPINGMQTSGQSQSLGMKQEHIQLTHKKIPSWATALCWKGEIFASEQQLRNNYFLMLPALLGPFSARFLLLCQCLCSAVVWFQLGEQQASCTSICAELSLDVSNLLWIPPAAW